MMKQIRKFTLTFIALTALSSGAHAAVYLVGFQLYEANSTGTSTSSGYHYNSDTNQASYVQSLTFGASTQGSGISFALPLGSDAFTFVPEYGDAIGTTAVNPGAYAGVEFFFNSTGTSFNPSSGGNVSNLTVYAASTAGSTFSTPASGTQVNDYGAAALVSDTGNTTYTVGGNTVTVSAFSVDTTPQGSFTFSVTPEPTSLGLLGLGAVTLLNRRRR